MELMATHSDASKCYTGEAPPERRTIHFIFADPILVAMECVSVSSSGDLKQDVRSCVRSVKIQKQRLFPWDSPSKTCVYKKPVQHEPAKTQKQGVVVWAYRLFSSTNVWSGTASSYKGSLGQRSLQAGAAVESPHCKKKDETNATR